MRAADLQLSELVIFEPGNVHLQGRRLVLHSIHAFANFRKDLLEMLGPEQTRRLFTRFGYFWGQADAAAMRRIHTWDDRRELLLAGFRLLSLEGIASAEVRQFDLGDQDRVFRMEVCWQNSGEAEEHLVEAGWAECPICWKLVGYASGYASYCLGTDVTFIERQCVARGDGVCLAEGRDLASWGSEVEEVLPFFQAEDIQGHVAKLTSQLERKMRELARQRRSFEILDHATHRPFVTGRSKALADVLHLSHRVAQFDSSVLITGETGVGKEVLAQYIHANSHRSDGPFIPINCGALPESLLESELFGHKRGAFTGADRDRESVFEQAKRGTIFLDEIGDISPAMQLRILRVLQEREIKRVGENRPRKIDVRVIAATHADLDGAVVAGTFREDLLYRLRVIEIHIPPLRDRPDDILPLARHIVEKLAVDLKLPGLRFDPGCLDLLQAYYWPGNVREMENAIERAAVVSNDALIRPEDFPPQVLSQLDSAGFPSGPVTRSLAEVELAYMRAVLKATNGNRTKAAGILGIGTTTLWRKLKETEG